MAKKTKSSKVYRIEYPIHEGRQNKILVVKGKSKKDAMKNAENKMVPEKDPLSGGVKITRVKGEVLHSEITPFNGVHSREDTLQTAAPQFPADRGDSNIR
jgi:hypothetical protein